MRTAYVFLLTGLLSVASTSEADNLGPRHHASGRNTEFRFATTTPFSDYVARTRALIAETRRDLTDENRERVINDNSPFEMVPDPSACPEAGADVRRQGALLVHGLTDSPFLMQDLGRRLADACLLVRSIVLPGHATVPGDLLYVKYGAWVEALQYGIQSFQDRPTDLFVVGFSTGAATALYNQLTGGAGSEMVKALVLLSPAIEVKSRFAFAADWYKIREVFVALDVKSREEFEAKMWLDIAPDEDHVKYESFAKNAGDQIYDLTKEIEDLGADRLSMPLFIAISEDDNTVNAKGAIDFFAASRDPRSRLILYTKAPNAGKDDDPRLVRRPSAYPDERILDFSHTAIPVAPDNRHYGRHGDYKNCMHYLEKPDKWAKCKASDPEVRLGENTKENLERHTIQRLTYNPDFDHLAVAIVEFLQSVR